MVRPGRFRAIERLASASRSAGFRTFILTGYFFPVGLAEFNDAYNLFAKLLLYAAFAGALFCIVLRMRSRDSSIDVLPAFVAVYFGAAILITLVVQGGLHEGLKTLFGWPLLFAYLLHEIRRDPAGTFRAIERVLCLFIVIDIAVTPLLIAPGSHIRVMGHIQVVSQICLLSWTATMMRMHLEGPGAWNDRLFLAPPILLALLTDADSAKLVMLLFLVWLLLYAGQKRCKDGVRSVLRRALDIDARLIVLVGLVLTVVTIGLSVARIDVFGLSLGFNGRSFVWREALEAWDASPLLGYGVQGIKLDLFWGDSFNYAHSQPMQELLDGGIVLAVLFCLMLWKLAVLMSREEEADVRAIFAFAFAGYLLVMVFDSVSYYCFFYAFMAFPVAVNQLKPIRKRKSMGIVTSMRAKFSNWYYPMRIRRKAAACGERLYCGGKSYVTPRTYLGEHVCFNGMAISGNGVVRIGSYFHSGPGCQIITSFHDYDHDDAIPYGLRMIDKDVAIGDCVWLGNNVIVLGGVTIGEGAVIQAGSVVCKDIPPHAVAGGHPALPFKTRDVAHYEHLKQLKAFH